MTGTGESLTHTQSHGQTYGGRRGHFGFHRPVILSCLLPDRGPAARAEGERGGKTLRFQAGERKPTQARNPPPQAAFPAHPQPSASMSHSNKDFKVVHSNVCAPFHPSPPSISLVGLPRTSHSQKRRSSRTVAGLPIQAHSSGVGPAAPLLRWINKYGCFYCDPITSCTSGL